MSDCIDIWDSIGLSCEGQNAVGGVAKRVWVSQLGQIDSYTEDGDGYIDTLTMATSGSTTYKLKTITGKKLTHSGTVEGEVGDNVNLINHSAILKVYPTTPADRDSLTALFKADELVVLFETENGTIEIYGLEKGMEASALSGSTGVGLQDDTGITLTLAGAQTSLPKLFKATGGTLADSVTYLNNISE